MPDVGVLNLQIHENSSKAEAGLDKVAGALNRIKAAVNGAGLKGVVSSLKGINSAINGFRVDGTIENLNGLAAALNRVKQACDFVIPNLAGLGKVKKTLQDFGKSGSGIRQTGSEVMGAVAEMVGGFDNIAGSVSRAREGIDQMNASLRETAALMRNTGWSNGQPPVETFSSMFGAWANARLSRSLPGGSQARGLMAGAIPAEGWVDGTAVRMGLPERGSVGMGNYAQDAFGAALESMREQIASGMSGESGGKTGIIPYIENARSTWEQMTDAYNAWKQRQADDMRRTIEMNREMADKYRTNPEQLRDSRMESAWAYIKDAKNYNSAEAMARMAGFSVNEIRDYMAAKGVDVSGMAQSGSERVSQMMGMSGIDLMRMRSRGLQNELAEKINAGSIGDNDIAKRIAEIQKLEEQIRRAEAAQADLLNQGGQTQVMDGLAQGAANATREIGKTSSAMERMREVASSIKSGFHELGKAMSKLPLARLGKQFLNMAKRMAIRATIKALTSSFKEGVQNVYEYSKAIGGSFATAVDNAKASMMTMKNSLGAAIAPAIQALIPVLQTVVSWVITAANAINQLLSLLGGRASWTRAVDQGTEALNKQKKAATGAGGAVKDMLAAWDELNVISNGGGGGGGGGAAALGTDYASMFEEATIFDDWIADLSGKIKDVVGWVEDHMESVKGIAAAIGALILGWKLATGFEGWLGKLGQWIALGAVIALTLQATWHLTNQYLETGDEGWLWASALTSAVGSVAAGVIAQKLLGGKAGLYTAAFVLALNGTTNIIAAIGDVNTSGINDRNIKAALLGSLEIGAAASIAMIAGGFSIGTALLAGAIATGIVFAAAVGIMAIVDANRTTFAWGDIELTEEQARRFALQKMFNVDVEATIQIISANVTEGQNLRADIENDLRSMMTDMKVINLGIATKDDYNQLNQDVDSVISHIKDYVRSAKETGALTLEFTPTLVGETAGEQNEWYKSYSQGWNKVQEFYEKKGKEIADCFVTSETGEIKLRSPELLQTLMTEMEKVTSAIANSKVASEAYANFAIGIGDLSEASAKKIKDYFKQYKKDLEEQYKALVNEQFQKQGQLVAALGEFDKNSAEYKAAVAKWKEMGENLNKAVQDGVASATASGKELVMEWLSGKIGKVSGGQYSQNAWKDILDANNITTESLQLAIQQMFYNLDVPSTVLDIMDMVEISGWDFLDDDLKKSLFDTVYEAIGDKAVPMLAKALKIPVKDIMSVVDWKSFTDKQRADFILSIGEAYGGSAAIQAAKAAGVNLGTVIGDGLSSQDEATRGKAQALVDSIRETLANSGVEVPVEASVDVLVNAMVEVEARSSTAAIQNVASTVKTAAQNAQSFIANMFGSGRKVKGAATGAYDIPSGELFMARENGMTEYIGSIGGKASVANNDQIEEGISKGVARANEEQNALLRQQNELLRRLLAKELKVDLGSRAGFGRMVRQSLDAYESMAGA